MLELEVEFNKWFVIEENIASITVMEMLNSYINIMNNQFSQKYRPFLNTGTLSTCLAKNRMRLIV